MWIVFISRDDTAAAIVWVWWSSSRLVRWAPKLVRWGPVMECIEAPVGYCNLMISCEERCSVSVSVKSLALMIISPLPYTSSSCSQRPMISLFYPKTVFNSWSWTELKLMNWTVLRATYIQKSRTVIAERNALGLLTWDCNVYSVFFQRDYLCRHCTCGSYFWK